MNLIKSKQPVAEHGEVFTPPKLVDAMLDLVKGETGRIDARFLKLACSVRNFLVPALRCKPAEADPKSSESKFEKCAPYAGRAVFMLRPVSSATLMAEAAGRPEGALGVHTKQTKEEG